MPYKSETAIVPITAPASPVLNPISGIMEKLGNNWWILIVVLFLFLNKGFGKGLGGLGNLGNLGNLGGFSNERLGQFVLSLMQPSLGGSNSTAAPAFPMGVNSTASPSITASPDMLGMLSGIINGMGGIEGLMQNIGSINALLQNVGGINGLLNAFGATK